MKLISINLSNKCIQNPRCSFCYLEEKKETKPLCRVHDLIEKYADSKTTICIEYNGYNLGYLFSYHWYVSKQKLTMTTMPCVITNTFCGAIKSLNIKFISLSYDSQKAKTPLEWFKKGQIIKSNKIGLGCNFLIEKIPFDIPVEIMKIANQLNLLSLKPTGKYNKMQLGYIKLIIEKYKSIMPIVVDNCLGVQLGFINKCQAGKEFIHINIEGKLEKCCFKEKCFLYKK